MSFNLYYGNDADALLRQLAQRLRAPAPSANLLAPEIILVPQFGLRRWLEIRLAEECGILANVDFFAPAEYAWRLLRAVHPDLHENSLFERKLLRWRVFAELAGLARDPRFGVLRGALADGEQSTRLRVADELAHLFERHLAYRSEMLAGWERGDAADDWQAELWRRLVRASAEPHRAHLFASYIRNYAGATTSPPGLPARLFAFACTNISPDLLRFFGVVAQHCELDFLMPNPCREYWGDARSEKERLREYGAAAFAEDENPLLAGYGRAGREFVSQLFSYDHVQALIDEDLSRERGRDTLLHCVQSDILARAAPVAARAVDAKDNSIQFHICHSRLREVQVLHDHLVDLFQRDASLTPRDVAIMAPDIAAYAPYVQAVFGGVAREDARHLPYTLSDCSLRESHALIGFAQKLITLPLSRMGRNEIFELLAEPAVLRRLGLDAAQLAQLADWLRDAGVRWGLNEAQHERFGAGRYREFSWAFGLERLLLGYATGETDALIAGIAPLPLVEGSGAQTLGALLRALDALETLAREQRTAQPAARWQQVYNAAFDALLDIDAAPRDEARALESMRNALATLAEDTAAAGLTEALDWQCVRDVLGERLSEPERSYRFFAGGISVASMLPLRVVPFRVICLIGMNDEVFPRHDHASALARSPLAPASRRAHVDRSDRDDDRYLFLQLLSSVRDVFYLSWIGEEPRDGAPREPSAVVAELLDVATRGYFIDADAARRALVVKHPLQPFSPRHFDASDARLFTYREQWRSASERAGRGDAAAAFVDTALALAPTPGDIDLDALQAFWRNPARAFFNDRLGLRLPRSEEGGDDSDPLDADGLMRYALVDALLAAQLARPDNSHADADYWRARGMLPVGIGGADALAAARTPARQLARVLGAARGDAAPSEPQAFEFEFADGTRLRGNLPEHHAGLIVRWSAGAASGSRLLRAWIDYLVLATTHACARLMLFGWEKDALQTLRFGAIDRASAIAELDRLIAGYRAGQGRPLLFFPKTSQAYAQRWRKLAQSRDRSDFGDIDADALEHARKTFQGSAHAPGGKVEADDPAYALAARGLDPFAPDAAAAEDFAQLALEVYAPLLAALGAQG
jgi:exodeoxyribonuclease V gamma subunit